jgi:hypothetical protein
MKKCAAEVSFQTFDRRRERGLRNPAANCRTRERLFFTYCQKILNGFEIQRMSLNVVQP